MATGGRSLDAFFDSGPDFVMTTKLKEDKWRLPSILSQECRYIPSESSIRKDIDVILWSNLMETIYGVCFNYNVHVILALSMVV